MKKLVAVLVIALVVAAAVVMVRPASVAGGSQGSPDSMLAIAADGISAAMDKGGAGVGFEVVQPARLAQSLMGQGSSCEIQATPRRSSESWTCIRL